MRIREGFLMAHHFVQAQRDPRPSARRRRAHRERDSGQLRLARDTATARSSILFSLLSDVLCTAQSGALPLPHRRNHPPSAVAGRRANPVGIPSLSRCRQGKFPRLEFRKARGHPATTPPPRGPPSVARDQDRPSRARRRLLHRTEARF